MSNLRISSWEIDRAGLLKISISGPFEMRAHLVRLPLTGHGLSSRYDSRAVPPWTNCAWWEDRGDGPVRREFSTEEIAELDKLVLDHPILRDIAWAYAISRSAEDG